MFTRCPECQTVHTLSASLLAHAAGTVRCGKCDREFKALAVLFDDWPEADSVPPTTGEGNQSPVLGYATARPNDPAPDLTPDPAVEETPDPENQQDPARKEARKTWWAVFVFLFFATLANLAWTFREPLLAYPEIRVLLDEYGITLPVEKPPFRDTGNLQLVSRDMHKHPTRAGILALSFTFVNRANRAQPYPNIEIILSDTANSPLARREFTPAEYLPSGSDIPDSLPSNVHVPVLLEFADPGATATSFELNFH